EAEGGSGTGMGMGMGLMMPAMFAQYFASAKPADSQKSGKLKFTCPECQNSIPTDSKFCPSCGHQQLVFTQCTNCGKNLTPNAMFCSRCGHPAEEKPKSKTCSKCGSENLAESIYCDECGEKL
ncbi:MAG: zinc ribbon domain-containing protein, partial [Deltaproteobacteria bacterium]|nr:zinc ribbon domain-containing protein [Deltaproteobacteria bacterium]